MLQQITALDLAKLLMKVAQSTNSPQVFFFFLIELESWGCGLPRSVDYTQVFTVLFCTLYDTTLTDFAFLQYKRFLSDIYFGAKNEGNKFFHFCCLMLVIFRY